MTASRSEFVHVRGLRYHVRRWGDASAPKVFLLHGWLDVSATWQYVAEGLLPRVQVLAPDWRGGALTNIVVFEFDGERIAEVFSIVNPDKLEFAIRQAHR